VDRSFVIVHISDLHLDGSSTYSGAINVLLSAIIEKMQDFSQSPDRILLLSGDIVDSPATKTFQEAKTVIERFLKTEVFTDIRAIAGNHDIKKAGLIVRSEAAYTELDLPRHSKSKFYPDSGLDLVLLDSNGASFAAKGEVDQTTYDGVVSNASQLASSLKKSVTEVTSEELAVVRILALHHHPLPQAAGEGKRVYGIPDEPLMYLVSPATFLAAAISVNANLILHGHRHVRGLTRYSIPRHLSGGDESRVEFWKDIYVLSCPSSTGHGGDDAGFNIIHFDSTFSNRRVQYNLEIKRFTRENQAGAFRLADTALPLGIIKLPVGRDIYRDPAFQVAVEIRGVTRLNRNDAIGYARRLLTRRALYQSTESSWAHGLYTFLVTYHVWEDLQNKFSSVAYGRDIEAFQKVRMCLEELISISCSALGITEPELDNLRSRPLINHAHIIDDLPQQPAPDADVADAVKRRRAAIQSINSKMRDLGVDLGLGGQPPSHFET
jgi:hypothetical protein